MKLYFGYIRVSTPKQGEKGVSLQEQKEAIQNYARRYGLEIIQWFEERETAAKRGRPVFNQMLRLIRQGKAQGVIIHKIDRSARNLKDWADLGELIDAGIEVHFANESLDLHTRGGRLSADIQAVVAADYIRNLREETKKGFYGRLKQGFYPIRAPIGYIDCGKAKAKEPDPVRAPLVTEAFNLYATGEYSLPRLLEELGSRGLKNRSGGRLHLNGLSTMLNNPFYMGLIRIRKTGELFPGNHEPLIGKALFDRVQLILRGKTVNRLARHDFAFRRMVRCAGCRYSLIGELQKGHVYYRCQTPDCPTTTIREECIDDAFAGKLDTVKLDEEEMQRARLWISQARINHDKFREDEAQKVAFRLNQLRPRLERLTDAFLDGTVERDLFENRKNALLLEEKELKEKLAILKSGQGDGLVRLEEFLELVNRSVFLYENALPQEKRDFVKKLTSNLSAQEKNVSVELKTEVQLLAERSKTDDGGPYRGAPRTLDAVLSDLLKYFSQNPMAAN